MLRLLFALIVFFHGLIHLLGFVKNWNLMAVSQLSGKTIFPLSEKLTKIVGLAWLLDCLCFALSAVAFLLRADWWWMATAGGLILSQLLVILYWRDAWAGTIVNVLLLTAVVVASATSSLQNSVRHDIRAMFTAQQGAQTFVVSREMLAALPRPVQKWLDAANVVGKSQIQFVRLKQRGSMRSKPDGSWMPVVAEQYIAVDKPAFVWKARMEYAPLLRIDAVDRYSNGKGSMLIRLLALFTISDSKGSEVDQGTLLRYLAEIVWYPTAALSNYIRWEGIDSLSARATMSYGDVTAAGIFRFDEHGDVIGFEAQRYGLFDGKYSMETWTIAMHGHKLFQGLRIPAVSEVTWKLKSGDFTWFKLEITELEFHRPTVYE